MGEDAARAFGASPGGNWAAEHGETNVLWRPEGTTSEMVDLEEARRVLFDQREHRARPATDDKVLTAWNAMAIQAFAEAGRAFGNDAFTQAAVAATEFVLKHLRRADGRLLRSWRHGSPGGPGYADDHALLASAMLSLFSRTGELRWFREARRLVDDLIRLFADQNGGFFQTGIDVDPLVIRPKELYDNAVPSGNSAAADVLQRMALLTGDAELERIGISALRVIRDVLGRAPTGFGHALSALDLYLGPSREVAIVGSMEEPATTALADEVLAARFLPNTVLAVGGPDDHEANEAVELLRDRPQIDGLPTAYVCRRFACRLPVTTTEDLADQLLEAGR
ncbi:MAG TPA: hypothetical protein VGZ51_05835 [Actinomycetota bacterium]|nr:hypothetical protein [Actinomycetota bacterium]